MPVSATHDPIADIRRAAQARVEAPGTGLTVVEVATPEDLMRHRQGWKALGMDSLHGNPVTDSVMMEAALETLAREGEEIRVALVRRGEALCGAFVFKLSQMRWGLPVTAAVPWAHKFCFTSAPLVRRSGAQATFSAFFEWLDEAHGGVPVLFEKVPAEGPFFAAFEQFLISTGRRYRLFDAHKRAALQARGEAEGWLASSLPSKKRKELRRQRKRLGELGMLAFEHLGPDGDVTGWCDDFMALEAAGWKGRDGSPLASNESLAAFVRRALDDEARDGRLDFWRLSLDGRPIAMTFAVRRPPQAWLLKIAHDESLARFSPGVQLMLDVSASLIADPEIDWVDSCADAGHPMIDHLWRDRFAVTDLLVAGRGGPSVFDFLCAAERLRRHARGQAKWLYHMFKEGLHR